MSNDAPLMQIGGVDKEHAEAVSAAIRQILDSGRSDDVVKEALRNFASVAEVKHITVTNSVLNGSKNINVDWDQESSD